ncbi:MAG: hypothetical protein ACE5F5_10410 [Acidimicrobiia bacterium]
MTEPVPVRLITNHGSKKAVEPTDPYEAVFTVLDTPGHDGLAEMARVFVEEFSLMGWDRRRIASMFRSPRYAAANAVYRVRGAHFVEELLDEVLGSGEEG